MYKGSGSKLINLPDWYVAPSSDSEADWFTARSFFRNRRLALDDGFANVSWDFLRLTAQCSAYSSVWNPGDKSALLFTCFSQMLYVMLNVKNIRI